MSRLLRRAADVLASGVLACALALAAVLVAPTGAQAAPMQVSSVAELQQALADGAPEIEVTQTIASSSDTVLTATVPVTITGADGVGILFDWSGNGSSTASLSLVGSEDARITIDGEGVARECLVSANSLTLDHVTIRNGNTTGWENGAVTVGNGNVTYTLRASGCVFEDNYSQRGPGALAVKASDIAAEVVGCTFAGNTTSSDRGSAICFSNGAGAVLDGVTIQGASDSSEVVVRLDSGVNPIELRGACSIEGTINLNYGPNEFLGWSGGKVAVEEGFASADGAPINLRATAEYVWVTDTQGNPLTGTATSPFRVTLTDGARYVLDAGTGAALRLRSLQVADPDGEGTSVRDVVEGETVELTPAEVEGTAFVSWEATGLALSDPTAETLTFAMPSNDVALTVVRHVHAWAAGWTSDASGHWHACTDPDCPVNSPEELGAYAAHAFGPDGACTVCGYVAPVEEPGSQRPGASEAAGGTVAGQASEEDLPATGDGSDPTVVFAAAVAGAALAALGVRARRPE